MWFRVAPSLMPTEDPVLEVIVLSKGGLVFNHAGRAKLPRDPQQEFIRLLEKLLGDEASHRAGFSSSLGVALPAEHVLEMVEVRVSRLTIVCRTIVSKKCAWTLVLSLISVGGL